MNMRYRLLLIVNLFIITGCATSFSQTSSKAKAEDVGMSSQRLARISSHMQAYIDDEKLAGISTVVMRRGKMVHQQCFGMANIATEKEMAPETIFRIYSMSKPIVSVGLMMLYEEGKFLLSDPVSKYIPALSGLKVFKEGVPAENYPVQQNAITIAQLLSHTAGLSYGFNPNYDFVDGLYQKKNIWEVKNLDEFVAKIGELPLRHEPGTAWHYSVATDMVGKLIEFHSGMSLDKYLKERIFDPLGMKDTGFEVPKEKVDRFAANYQPVIPSGLRMMDDPAKSRFLAPVTFFSGGGGLVSTTGDYMRFAKMLVNKGEVDGVRLLSPKTIELMTQNFIPGNKEFDPGFGFGLGFAVLQNLAAQQTLGSVGQYGWSGAANTYFWVDPEEEMVMMVWMQLMPHGKYPIANEFKTLVYQAIID